MFILERSTGATIRLSRRRRRPAKNTRFDTKKYIINKYANYPLEAPFETWLTSGLPGRIGLKLLPK